MKKLIAIIALFFAFTITASAQDSKSVEKNSQTVATEIGKFLNLDTHTTNQLYEVLLDKNTKLSNTPHEMAYQETLIVTTRKINKDFSEILGDDMFQKLKNNTALYEKAIK
jgi:hypothetical protein